MQAATGSCLGFGLGGAGAAELLVLPDPELAALDPEPDPELLTGPGEFVEPVPFFDPPDAPAAMMRIRRIASAQYRFLRNRLRFG